MLTMICLLPANPPPCSVRDHCGAGGATGQPQKHPNLGGPYTAWAAGKLWAQDFTQGMCSVLPFGLGAVAVQMTERSLDM